MALHQRYTVYKTAMAINNLETVELISKRCYSISTTERGALVSNNCPINNTLKISGGSIEVTCSKTEIS